MYDSTNSNVFFSQDVLYCEVDKAYADIEDEFIWGQSWYVSIHNMIYRTSIVLKYKVNVELASLQPFLSSTSMASYADCQGMFHPLKSAIYNDAKKV